MISSECEREDAVAVPGERGHGFAVGHIPHADLAKQREAEKQARSYDTLFAAQEAQVEDEEPTANQYSSVREMEEDFM